MRMIRLVTATAALLLAVSGGPVAAAPDEGGSATLTLRAVWQSVEGYAWIDEMLAESVLLSASGPVATLSGPSGTRGVLPAGSYVLELLHPSLGTPVEPGGLVLFPILRGDGVVLGYVLAEVVCSNAPSGVGAVELAPGDDVICTFELDWGIALPGDCPGCESGPGVPPGAEPDSPQLPEASGAGPPSRAGPPEGLPVTGPETTVPAVTGTVLVLLGGALLLVSRRRPRPGTVSGSR